MSLFFLKLSFLTYFSSHYWARKTKPQRNFTFGNLFTFQGEVSDFTKKLHNWTSKHPYLKIIEQTDGEMIISEKASLFSYGYFYHIQWTQKEKGLEVIFCVQPKLINLHGDKQAIDDKFSQALDLKNVS